MRRYRRIDVREPWIYNPERPYPDLGSACAQVSACRARAMRTCVRAPDPGRAQCGARGGPSAIRNAAAKRAVPVWRRRRTGSAARYPMAEECKDAASARKDARMKRSSRKTRRAQPCGTGGKPAVPTRRPSPVEVELQPWRAAGSTGRNRSARLAQAPRLPRNRPQEPGNRPFRLPGTPPVRRPRFIGPNNHDKVPGAGALDVPARAPYPRRVEAKGPPASRLGRPRGDPSPARGQLSYVW